MNTRFTPQEERAFRQLTTSPPVAVPTVLLFFACMAAIGAITTLALTGVLALWQGALLNGLAVYFLFSVVHDSSHGAISQNKVFNDAFGHIGMLFFGPLAPFNLARWIHMQHHRFTNDLVKDPDFFGHKMDLLTPLRWANFDFFYTLYFLRHGGAMRQKFALRTVLQFALVIGLTVAAFHWGYGEETVMLWLLPTRISSALFVLAFVYMPHAPFTVTAQEDEYKASNIRAGMEWLLTPLLAFQNYHLVHHLYPRAPFYRMIKIWNARRAFHLARQPYFVHPLSVGKAAPQPSI